MPLRLLVLRVLACLLALAGADAVAAGPARADNIRLCVGYTGCSNAGMSASGYATARNTMYWRMYSGHNCTNYAAYRMVHSGLPNVRPWTGSGNATNWGIAMSRITSQTPTVGAVAWWKAYVSPAGSAGHVAYVEKVVSPTEIIVSQDSWGGDFSWARITKTGRGWPSGFVHFNDLKIRNTAAPTITGFVKVGGKLTVSAGTWSQTGLTVRYQWRANGAALPGATTSTLTVAPAQQGQRISASVTVSKLGYPTATLTSAATAAVLPGVLSQPALPTVSGTAQVGTRLVATPGTWSPTPSAITYQWLADGVAVPGRTTTTWTPGPGMVGKKISFRVTASRLGYTTVSSDVTTDPVVPGVLTVTAAPALSGTAALGQTLSLNNGAVTRTSTAAVQWLRGGVPVAGATGPTYTVSKADLGSRVAAEVTWTRAGYTTVASRTPSSVIVRSDPVLRVTTTPGRGRLATRIGVSAAGVRPVPGRVRISSGGVILREVTLRNGVATPTIGQLKPGLRTFKFRYLGDPKVRQVIVWKTVRIR